MQQAGCGGCDPVPLAFIHPQGFGDQLLELVTQPQPLKVGEDD